MKGLLQIHDPLKPKGHAVGIDLGTTNSLVASVINGKPRCLPADEDAQLLLPSVVHYGKDGGVVVGARALALLPEFPTDTLKSVKRFMGKSLSDAETTKLGSYKFTPGTGVVRFEVSGGQPVTPIEASGEILRALKRRAETHYQGKVEQAVITVPAYFDDAQRQATRDAGRIAGLDVLRIVNEPTAAALAYGLDRTKSGIVAVYDLGGGTFDCSLLQLTDGVFKVLSTNGDTQLGGDDFDHLLMELAAKEMGLTPEGDAELLQRLRDAAEKAKIALSTAETTTFWANPDREGGGARLITRGEFESLIAPLIDRSLANRNCANDRATSVLPTPVGPKNRKEPTGRKGFLSPARERLMARASAEIAGR